MSNTEDTQDWPWAGKDPDALRRLWDKSEQNWVLLKNADGSFTPYNKDGHVLLIEPGELNKLVCQRMMDAECDVLTDIPQADASVDRSADS